MGFINIFKPLFTFLLPASLINLSNFDNWTQGSLVQKWKLPSCLLKDGKAWRFLLLSFDPLFYPPDFWPFVYAPTTLPVKLGYQMGCATMSLFMKGFKNKNNIKIRNVFSFSRLRGRWIRLDPVAWSTSRSIQHQSDNPLRGRSPLSIAFPRHRGTRHNDDLRYGEQ